ncbi:D site-binding protein isoform X2 [Rhipicephalus sanguineus]|uniref:D site-binding protein isoform X2 n=1 Tax=Rhipicephalus sanguineus TaxID=34632 RepID=UPI001895672A|nr:D site-binding protein isoform X2 [Rhipicephalus sanguineus]
MLSSWSVTGMAKNHHCISVVYRDTTQADYDASGDAINRSSSRHASTGSNHLDTDLNSPTRMYNGLAQDKVLTSLDKPTAETGLPGQAFSPASIEMWEQNETFQDLSELIQEGKAPAVLPPASSQSCYTLPSSVPSHQISSTSSGTVSAAPSRSCNSSPSTTSQTTWQLQPPPASTATTTTAVSVKRPLSPVSEPGPSHASGRCSPKLQKLEEPPRYTDMRVKNNIASRRSRMTRKEKELEMEKRASELEQENELLRIKVKNLEELTDRLKKHLISSIVKK